MSGGLFQVHALEDRLKAAMGPLEYDAWLGNAHLTLTEAGLRVIIGTGFISDHLRKTYNDVIEREVEATVGGKVPITYIVAARPQDALRLPPTPPDAIFRAALTEVQPDFFIPDITEVALKDDVHLMELAPFTLQPRGETRTELAYTTAAGMDIRIVANPKYGLPTSNDYNIVLMMESYLANMANHYREEMKAYDRAKKAGQNPKMPAKPPRYFEPTVSEILSFTRTQRGGVQQDRIVPGLDRLHNTTCKINIAGRRKTRTGSFSFIGSWEVVTENATGNVTQVRINIPDWIYQGIVEVEKPTILTYDRDYLLLNDPFMMVFYRFIRLKVDKDGTPYVFTASDLHARSNSRQSLKEFNRELRAKIKKTNGYLLGYQLTLVGQRDTLGIEVKMVGDETKPAPDLGDDGAAESGAV